MAETVGTKRAEAMAVKLVDPFESPSISSTAENILAEAIAFCAQKMGASSQATVIDLLEQKDKTACEYCLYGVAKQVAAFLGSMDENVQAVYLLDYDATPEDLCFGAGAQDTRLIHLLVWTRRKTAALDSLVSAWDRALAQAYSDTTGVPGQTTLLDVQVIDDADVKLRRGYGAFRAWMHQQPIQLWNR